MTNARLIGFKSTWARLTLLAGPAIAAAGGIFYLLQSAVSPTSISVTNPSVTILGTLGTLGTSFFLIVYIVGPSRASHSSRIDVKKDFEVRREFVRGIEVKRPRSFSTGYVTIDVQSGDTVKIIIANKNVFRKIMELVSAFYPEVQVRP